jgi:hypothetical protein
MSFSLTLLENVVIPYQNFLGSIGIDSSFKLGIATAAITSGILWAVKPGFAFDSRTGEPRPWSILAEEGEESTEPTAVPWYVFSGGVFYTLYLIG